MGDILKFFLLECSGKLKQKNVWRPPWMRIMSYFNVRSRTSIPKTLQFANTSGSHMVSSPPWHPENLTHWHGTYHGRMPQKAGQRVSLSPTQHVAAGWGHHPGVPSLPQAYRLVLALWSLFACLGWLVPEIHPLKLSWKHEVRPHLTSIWHSHSLFTSEGTWVCYFSVSVLRLYILEQ